MDVEISNLCKIHQKKFEMYCVDDKKKICLDCLWEHSKQKHELMSLSDYHQVVVLKKIAHLSSIVDDNFTKINDENQKFIVESTALLENTMTLKEIVTSLLENINLLENNLLHFLDNDKDINFSVLLKTKLSNMKGDIKIPEELFNLEKDILQTEEHISFLLNYEEAYAKLKEKFLVFQKNIAESSVLNQILSICKNMQNNVPSKWSLDSANASKAIKFSNNNLTVEKIHDKNYTSVIGTEEFSTGKHKWNVTIDNLCMNVPLKNHWINMGILEKKDFDIKKESHFSNSYSLSTCNQKYKVEGNSTYIMPGDIITMELDCDAGTFQILGKGIDCKAEGLKGKVLVPYLELFKIENKCTISVIE